MSKIPAILSATLTMSLAACGGQSRTPVGQALTMPLVTSSPATVGSVTVFNSTDGLFITATAASGWLLRETRLSVTTSLNAIPHSQDGKAWIDGFVLRNEGSPSAAALSYSLPLLVAPGTQLFLSLHADLCPVTATTPADDGHSGGSDPDDDDGGTSAWAQGVPFLGDPDALYFTYVVQAAAPPTLAGLFRTQTQAEWGADPQSSASASYLVATFGGAFPLGATIGASPGNGALFTNAQMVLTFLPQTGTSAPLTRWMVDPPTLNNPFAGEVLALTLNIGFDAFDPTFSPDPGSFSALVVADPGSPY